MIVENWMIMESMWRYLIVSNNKNCAVNLINGHLNYFLFSQRHSAIRYEGKIFKTFSKYRTRFISPLHLTWFVTMATVRVVIIAFNSGAISINFMNQVILMNSFRARQSIQTYLSMINSQAVRSTLTCKPIQLE